MTIRSNGAGHGGRKNGSNWMDPGAVGNGRREADVVRTITQKMRAIANVRDTTDNNGITVNQNLQNQVTLMNAAGSGVAITSHLNAFNSQAHGVEVFYWAGNEQMRILAAAVSKAIADTLGIPNRGAKPTTTFFVHRNTNEGVNVLLIEWCFIDNKSDMEKLDRNMDAAIRAVMNVLGYGSNGGGSTPAPKPNPAPTPKPTQKSNDTIAQEVIDGKWGNGADREKRLRAAGYNPAEIQRLVNQKLGGGSKPAPKPQPQLKGSNLPNRGSYKFPVNTNIRAAASTSAAIVGMYNAGQTVNYDSKVIRDGRVWLSWIGASGNRRYSAVV